MSAARVQINSEHSLTSLQLGAAEVIQDPRDRSGCAEPGSPELARARAGRSSIHLTPVRGASLLLTSIKLHNNRNLVEGLKSTRHLLVFNLGHFHSVL